MNNNENKNGLTNTLLIILIILITCLLGFFVYKEFIKEDNNDTKNISEDVSDKQEDKINNNDNNSNNSNNNLLTKDEILSKVVLLDHNFGEFLFFDKKINANDLDLFIVYKAIANSLNISRNKDFKISVSDIKKLISDNFGSDYPVDVNKLDEYACCTALKLDNNQNLVYVEPQCGCGSKGPGSDFAKVYDARIDNDNIYVYYKVIFGCNINNYYGYCTDYNKTNMIEESKSADDYLNYNIYIDKGGLYKATYKLNKTNNKYQFISIEPENKK